MNRSKGIKLHFLLLVVLPAFLGLFTACGGGGSSAPPPQINTNGLTVSSVTPSNGTVNVDRHATITATLSEPLALPATEITASGRFTLDKGITGTVTYDWQTQTATFIPSSVLARNTVYTVTISANVKNQLGNPMAADKIWTFTTMDELGAWPIIDGDVNGISKNIDTKTNQSIYAWTPSLTTANNLLYATWAEGRFYDQSGRVRVASYNGNDTMPNWTFLDGGSSTGINKDAASLASTPQLASDGNVLYAAWKENCQIRVSRYTGSAWSFIDGNGVNGLNRNTAVCAGSPQITIFGDKLYIIWQEQDAPAWQIRVAVFSGNAWSFVDGNVSTTGINHAAANSALEPRLTVFNNNLYAIWDEHEPSNGFFQTPGQIRVAVYSGGTWSFVDGNGANGINKDTTLDGKEPQLTVSNGKLYATWVENSQVRVALYSGSSWSFVDGGVANKGLNNNTAYPFPEGMSNNSPIPFGASHPYLTDYNNRLFATWDEGNGAASEIRMAVYNNNDSSPAWSFLDGGGYAGINKSVGGRAYTPQLMVFNNKLYVAWSEENTYPGGPSGISQIHAVVGQ